MISEIPPINLYVYTSLFMYGDKQKDIPEQEQPHKYKENPNDLVIAETPSQSNLTI